MPILIFFFKKADQLCVWKNMENLRKRVDVKLINNSKDYVRIVSRRNFNSQKIFNKNFAAIQNCYSDRHLFDFSDYPLDSKYYAVSNKRYPGKMKNEYKGEIITEFLV